jgi:hypothetical protein
MLSKPFAVAALVLTAVTAAASGAYLAVRHNAADPAAAPAPASQPGSRPAAAESPAVLETEGVISPLVPPSQAPVEASEPAPVERERPAATASSAGPATAKRAARQGAARATPPEPVRPPARASRPAAPEPTLTASAAGRPTERGSSNARPEAAAPIDPAPVEAPRAAARSEAPAPPPLRSYDELVIPPASVIGLQIETPVSSERARLEDRVEARVLRDVAVAGRTAVPAGARALGVVTEVDRGGRMKERARLGVRFHTLVLADGTQLAMRTDTIIREGESPAGDSARKIGGAAVGGALLGAIIGGKKGAVVGGAAGAAGGSAVVMSGDRNAATLPVGAVVTVRLAAPVSVDVERR